MLRAGLTGGIGSGKSEVSRRLVGHGAVIIDADVAARAVVAPGTPGLARVAEVFGAAVLGPYGALDRERLGAIVFGDPAARASLNAIVHPLVGQWMRAAEADAMAAAGGDVVIVHDEPLLTENRRADGFDLVIVVDVSPEVQAEHVLDLQRRDHGGDAGGEAGGDGVGDELDEPPEPPQAHREERQRQQ